MRKTLIYKKRVQDETGREYILWYSLVIRVAEHGRIYGVEIEKTNEYGRQERALIAGISEEKKGNTVFSGKTLVRSCHAGRAECTV